MCAVRCASLRGWHCHPQPPPCPSPASDRRSPYPWAPAPNPCRPSRKTSPEWCFGVRRNSLQSDQTATSFLLTDPCGQNTTLAVQIAFGSQTPIARPGLGPPPPSPPPKGRRPLVTDLAARRTQPLHTCPGRRPADRPMPVRCHMPPASIEPIAHRFPPAAHLGRSADRRPPARLPPGTAAGVDAGKSGAVAARF